MTAALASLTALLEGDPALTALLGRRAPAVAIPEPAHAIALAHLAEASQRRPVLVIAPTGLDAERLTNDLRLFCGHDEVERLPAWETLPFERMSPSVETMGHRLRVLWRLRSRPPRLAVASLRSALQRLGPSDETTDPLVVGVGDVLDPQELVAELVRIGYRRDVQVEHRGDVAVRGSIVDVFPSTTAAPVRIDLWGDEVDRLGEFSVADQRSRAALAEVEIFPCREVLPDETVRSIAERLIASAPWGREQWTRLSDGEIFEGMESWLPWVVDHDRTVVNALDADAQVVLVEPSRLRARAVEIIAEESDLADTLARTWGAVDDDEHHDFPRLHVPLDDLLERSEVPVWSVTATAEGPDMPVMAASGWDGRGGAADDDGPLGRLASLLASGYGVVVGADGAGSAGRLTQNIADHGVDLAPVDAGADLSGPGGRILVAGLERSVVLPDVRLALVSEGDLTGRRRPPRPPRRPRGDAQRFFDDLEPGDYVVHHHHGVARYVGMVTRAIGGNERDYLLLEYRGDDKLYVPTDQIDTVRHYTGGETPRLNRMGGSDWQKAKGKVRAAVQEIAQELVVLYQRRAATVGHAFAPDTPWQAELEAAFPYQETPDQLAAIEAVKADMELPRPMDRLVCGDVGFGKTEIALRAAFKAVQDGKQVAVLVPTTLLAQQHHQTFAERLAPYPVRVEALSRFLTPGQARTIVTGIETGEVDVVIGTHRLLSADVRFRDLGLLVVDEEQRFGVSHKEAVKRLKTDIDVLTLTATPIPRTLEMSLTGIRDLTILNTPPAERQPILTYVGEFDERAVTEAIRRELLRDGQVFFVHNRVLDIDLVADDLRRVVPEARVAVAHGQMDEARLERIVLEFWEGEHDVLVCTTIIESGIDMATVNTLVVDRADLMGLGQLHQLRGRVGRSGSRAYAYLFTPRDRVLTEEAYERLKTIGESTDLGSGFKIAMRDLEIRGAGNLLGVGQSGHIAAVGYDLYCQLVTEAVADLKGEVPEEVPDVNLELPVDAHLPAAYVPRESLRLEAYRRLAAITSDADLADVRSEWEDRYGPIPEAALALLAVAELRVECLRVGVDELSVVKGPGLGGPSWIGRLSPVRLRPSKAVRLERLYPKSSYREETGRLQLALPSAAEAPQIITAVLRDLIPTDEAVSA